jgi:low affinity Fe/Cu permease
MRDLFRQFARIAADSVGSPAAFLLGVGVTLVWAVTGPYFKYSDTWQLVINTSTSIGTFLIVFLIQNTQNRDAKVMHLKLDELIRAVKPARTELVQMETMTDAELDELQQEFQSCRDEASRNLILLVESRSRKIQISSETGSNQYRTNALAEEPSDRESTVQ